MPENTSNQGLPTQQDPTTLISTNTPYLQPSRGQEDNINSIANASTLSTSSPTVSTSTNKIAGEDGTIFLDRYSIEKSLGEGSFGKVKLAYDMKTKRKTAIKIISKSTLKKVEHVTRIKREVRIMRLLNHPNIVKLYDVAETEKEIVLAMEFVEGGELFDYIVAHPRLPEKTARRIFRQLVSAVDYCHQSSIIHRDLKPENLLLDYHKNVKIIDFGFVNMFNPDNVLNTFCGSPFYASPGKKYTGPEVDIWSMGVILYALLAGQLPFRDANTKNLYKKITSCTYEIPTHISKEGTDLIKSMLQAQPTDRINIAQIRIHPWIMEEYGYPPDSFLPPRPALSSPLDPNIIENMKLYGFEAQSATDAILGAPDGPAYCLYYLLKERDQHEKSLRVSSSVVSSNDTGNGSAVSLNHSNSFRVSTSNARGRSASIANRQNTDPRSAGSMNAITKKTSISAANSVNNDIEKAGSSSRRVTVQDNNGKDGRRRASSKTSNTSRGEGSDHEDDTTKSYGRMNFMFSKNHQVSNMSLKARRGSTKETTSNDMNNENGQSSLPKAQSRRASVVDMFKKTVGKIFAGERRNSQSSQYSFNPKEVKTFSASMASGKSPTELKEELNRVMKALSIEINWSGFVAECKTDALAFDIEICRLMGTNIFGLECRRRKGSVWTYQTTFKTLVKTWTL